MRKDMAGIKGTKDYLTWVLKKGKGFDDQKVNEYLDQLTQAMDFEQNGDKLAEEWNNDEALVEYRKAVELEMAATGTEHPDIADLYVKVADTLILDGKDLDAIMEYNRALVIYKNVFGDDHPYCKSTLEKMDPATAAKGKKGGPSKRSSMQKQISVEDLLRSDKMAHQVDKAVKHLNRDRVEFRSRNQGGYESAGRYFQIGMGFYHNRNYSEALLAFRRSWRIRDNCYGRDHQQTQHTMQWISKVLLEEQKDVKKYRENMYDSADMYRQGCILQEQGKTVSALREFQRAAMLEETVVGVSHLEYADLKARIGDLLLEKGDYEPALAEYRKALLIYQSAIGRGHPVTKKLFKKMDAVSETSSLLIGVSAHGK